MKLLIENWRRFIKEETFPIDIEEEVLAVFDFDDTLAHTDSSSKLLNKDGEVIRVLQTQKDQDKLTTDMEKNPDKYKGMYFDFSDFSDIQNAEHDEGMVKRMVEYDKDPSAQVIILTARDPIAEDAIQSYFNELGVGTENLIIKGLAGKSKGDYILSTAESNPSIKKVLFWDDSEKNVNDVKNKFKDTDIELDATLVKK
jgi:hypothetical protein